MRNTLLLSLLALAAASQASLVANSSAHTTATVDFGAAVTMGSVGYREENYSLSPSLFGPDYFDVQINGGGATGTVSSTGIHSYDGRTFVMGSVTSASLSGDTAGFSRYSKSLVSIYEFALTNSSAVDQTITFNLQLDQSSSVHVTGKGYTDADPTGEWAESYGGGFAHDDQDAYEYVFPAPPETWSYSVVADPDIFYGYNSKIGTNSYQTDLTITKVLPANSSRQYFLNANSYAYVAYWPQAVPEPAPLAALGLGALALLRRRARR